MIKTTYFCDCCKQIIPDDADHIQMVPTNEDGYTLDGYQHMSDEVHFCKACADRIIAFAFNPVDIAALQASISEDAGIIAALNAELEEARKALAERTEEQPAEESDIDPADPPAPAAKAKCRMTGKRSPVDKQQVIRLYRDDVSFIMFDVYLPASNLWLKREAIGEIAKAFNVEVVPIVIRGTLDEIVSYVKAEPWSVVAKTHSGKHYLMEGVVCKPAVEVLTRMGDRIMVKVKVKDFC